jgi:hypothetical protein
VRIVLREFHAETSGLNADRGVALRIKPGGTSQDLSCDLVLLQSNSGVIKGVLGEIAKQPAQRFGAVKDMAFCKSLYLLEALLPTDRETVCHSHRNREVTEEPNTL